MRAVWSFWTKPFAGCHGNGWLTSRHHLLSWVLSFEAARKHYPRTALVTDSEGAELLAGKLGLEFTFISTALDGLRGEDPAWWALGKLWTYRLQTEPFVHVDSDAFLWRRLPPEMERAPVLAQNPETFPLSPESWYRANRFTTALRQAGGWMPEEWEWASHQVSDRAVCCGILGGNDLPFLARYADLAIRMIQHPRNRVIWRDAGANTGDNVLFEQYLLAACLEYHHITAQYLFDSMEESFDEDAARQRGYTHLIGGAKRNRKLARALENRVARDYPERYERCCSLSGLTSTEPHHARSLVAIAAATAASS